MLAGLATSAGAQRPVTGLPPVPAVHGPLKPQVAYPAAGALIDAGDSTFLFGSVGDGEARLTVAGQPVAVAPNGAWIAWIAIPRDSAFSSHWSPSAAPIRRRHSLRLVRAGWVRETGAWVDRHRSRPPARSGCPKASHLP